MNLNQIFSVFFCILFSSSICQAWSVLTSQSQSYWHFVRFARHLLKRMFRCRTRLVLHHSLLPFFFFLNRWTDWAEPGGPTSYTIGPHEKVYIWSVILSLSRCFCCHQRFLLLSATAFDDYDVAASREIVAVCSVMIAAACLAIAYVLSSFFDNRMRAREEYATIRKRERERKKRRKNPTWLVSDEQQQPRANWQLKFDTLRATPTYSTLLQHHKPFLLKSTFSS